MPRLALCAALSLAACGDGGGPIEPEPLDPIPADTLPCDEPGYWPLALASDSYPLVVHYRGESEADGAAEVLALLETSWRIEVAELGFRAPLSDGGACGPDGGFDVFIWRGSAESYVDVLAEEPSTAWDDYSGYMVVDPWGPYGGEILDSTIAHEFNHACQAADDWWDAPIVFEMTSTFIEEVVFDDDDNWREDPLTDFQAHADWAFDRDDEYETWYMYGSSLYLMFLRERYFEGDAGFAADMWLGARSEPESYEPDFADALDDLLAPHGTTYVDSVVELAAWRWYTGARDDGAHFEEGAQLPATAEVPVVQVRAGAAEVELDPAPMLLGSAYVEVVRMAGDAAAVEVDLISDAGEDEVVWVVQVVPGDQRLALPARLELPEGGARTLVITAVPVDDGDPDDRTDDRYPASITLTPAD